MIVEMPEGMNRDNFTNVVRRGELRLLALEGEALTYRWALDDDSTSVRFDFNFERREIEVPDEAPAAQRDMLSEAVEAWGAEPDWYDAARKIVELAESAVGQEIGELSGTERWMLLAALLWRAGGIGDDLRVRPLAEWIARLPDA